MIRSLSVALLAFVFALSPALAQEDDGTRADAPPMPETLVIGYDQEGHVDPTEDSCRVFVTEMVEWEKAEMDQAVRNVCEYRQKHADAYKAFQGAYGKFRSALQKQIRFDGGAAARALGLMVKSCIDMKWALSTGGHNVGIDMIPNEIAVTCLEMGRQMLVKETDRLNIDEPQPKSGH
jgi:hypothetical protein